MNTFAIEGNEVEHRAISDDLYHEYYSDMAALVDELVLKVSGYTPENIEAFNVLRVSASKFFRNYIDEIEDLINRVRYLDENLVIQGTLFDDV
jgi:predicted RecB family endonuclease